MMGKWYKQDIIIVSIWLDLFRYLTVKHGFVFSFWVYFFFFF